MNEAIEVDLRLSIVIPVYNEVESLGNCVAKLQEALEGFDGGYEILIAEDGSTDGSAELALKLADENPAVRHLHSDARLGRGKALVRAFLASRGRILAFMDSDLATDLKHLQELVDAIEGGIPIAIGSRLMPSSDIKRPWTRELTSRSYNLLVKLLFGAPLHDMQCGFKAFKRETLLDVMDEIEDTHWFWDTEFLLRAYHKGYKIAEIPVKWRHSGRTKVRLFRDSRQMGTKLIKLWWKLRNS